MTFRSVRPKFPDATLRSASRVESAALGQPGRLDWLDALRGWAVLGVLMVHAGNPVPGQGLAKKVAETGQYGVQLFFIVSALTISMTYESHIARFGTSLRSQLAWFTKRFFRIAPLYYLAAILYPIEQLIIYDLSHHHYGSETRISNVIANILFLHTWIPSANNSVVPGGWSIGVEMFFYLLVPVCWLLVPVRHRVRALGLVALTFLTVTELVSKLSTGGYFVGNNTYLYYWFPTEAPVLIIGLVFYFFYKSELHSQSSSKYSVIWLCGFLGLFLAGVYLGTWKGVMPVASPTILAFAFISLILGLSGWMRAIVGGKLAVFLGRISFSIYIFHFIVLDCLRAVLRIVHFNRSWPLTLPFLFVVTVVVTSGVALVSKRAIEDPAIGYGHKLSRLIASGLVGAQAGPAGQTIL